MSSWRWAGFVERIDYDEKSCICMRRSRNPFGYADVNDEVLNGVLGLGLDERDVQFKAMGSSGIVTQLRHMTRHKH